MHDKTAKVHSSKIVLPTLFSAYLPVIIWRLEQWSATRGYVATSRGGATPKSQGGTKKFEC